jgi:nucleotide-binding universal stress UspA family protein
LYKRIMVVVDDRPVSQYAVNEGVALARIHEAEIEFLALMPRIAATPSDLPSAAAVAPPEVEQAMRRAADELLGRMVSAAEREGVMARGSKGHEEDGAGGVVAAALRRRCELIVAASAGRNAVMRLFVESLIPGLITASPLPLLICKEPREAHTEADGAATGSSRGRGARGGASLRGRGS